MDHENFNDARLLDPSRKYHDRIRLFCDFCTQHDEREVPDPYYGGAGGFEHVLDLIEDGCRNLLDQLTD